MGFLYSVRKRVDAQVNIHLAMMSLITEFLTLGVVGNSPRKFVVEFAIILCDLSPKCRAKSKDRRKY